MKSRRPLPIPVSRALQKLGQDIQDARKRRRITIALMSERAGISKSTVGRVEKGDPSTSMGSYCSVLFVLGMIERLSELADLMHDNTGKFLADEALPIRVRHKKNKDK